MKSFFSLIRLQSIKLCSLKCICTNQVRFVPHLENRNKRSCQLEERQHETANKQFTSSTLLSLTTHLLYKHLASVLDHHGWLVLMYMFSKLTLENKFLNLDSTIFKSANKSISLARKSQTLASFGEKSVVKVECYRSTK